MVVNRAMASLPMCVSRLRNMAEPLYSNPQKDPSTVEALNNTQVPPPFEVPEVAKEIKVENEKIKEESPTVTIIATAATSKVTGNNMNESVKNIIESGEWEIVHENPPVNIIMDEIQPVQPPCENNGLQQPNGILQDNATTWDDKSLPSSVTPSHDSATVRTYTPLTNLSEESTALEPDGENLEDSTLGMLQPKKELHAFTPPDLFKNTPENSDVASVSD